eukprot:gnl/TRDRNA2_/TRDRNA2_148717_c0_seq1.p1 gnl/TRDRNA2_/TRDRNA2_148717_c0~~gnl/TRDRNA2_/TRDRNA2_148717_c0_seq1.p1  ORF type:complete len:457 (+),score=89.51 gnl/TRDRNA2_/TRDRNA2_148717_c0_seq1:111-1481(+)
MEATKFQDLTRKLHRFMAEHIYPNEQIFLEQCDAIREASNEWTDPPVLVELKERAKLAGLWNLWLPNDTAATAGSDFAALGGGLSNIQYASLCEIMGTSSHMEMAAQAMNCASPDTGNMETLARFGSDEQKKQWLKPLLEGKIRSCFAMTEPAVASSDATNIQTSIQRDEAAGMYVVNGRKWWITGAGSLHCKIMILMGKTDPAAESFRQQSMLLVPMDTPGITLLRPMQVIGDPEAPKGHMEILFENVRVPLSNILAGEGRGFEISQARLGPGRIHHCMRLLGTAERALSLMCRRASERKAFGKQFRDFDTVLQDIAKSRAEIDQARMLVHRCADMMDRHGNKVARQQLSLAKAVIPPMVQTICDRAMQVHGAMGLSQDTFLATAFVWARWLRFADGPEEVHWRTAARLELQQQQREEGSDGRVPLYRLGYYTHDSAKVFRRSTDPVSAEARARL